MVRRLVVIALLSVAFCGLRTLRAENVADIIEADTPGNAQKKPADKTAEPKRPSTVVDEPGFKATAKFAEKPNPNFDPGTKNTNQIPVPKRGAWAVPLEDGFTGSPSSAPSADAAAQQDDKNQAGVAELISPSLAAAIAREKAGIKPKEMIAVYKELVRAEPDNAAPRYRLGLAMIRAGETQNGLVELEATIALQPKNTKYLGDYSILALKAGWVEKAFATCQAAASLAPGNPRFHSTLGDIHLTAGHLPEAAESYTRALKLDPANSVYFYNLGLVYMHSRDFKRAAELFDEAVRLKPTASAYYCSRGLAFENLKNHKRAIDDYVAALKLDKNSAYGHYLLAGIFSDPDDPTYTNRFEAIEHAEKAVKLTNYKSAQYLMGLARALRVAHNYDQASDAARKAVELEPAREDYRKELAQYEQMRMPGFGK